MLPRLKIICIIQEIEYSGVLAIPETTWTESRIVENVTNEPSIAGQERVALDSRIVGIEIKMRRSTFAGPAVVQICADTSCWVAVVAANCALVDEKDAVGSRCHEVVVEVRVGVALAREGAWAFSADSTVVVAIVCFGSLLI